MLKLNKQGDLISIFPIEKITAAELKAAGLVPASELERLVSALWNVIGECSAGHCVAENPCRSCESAGAALKENNDE